MKDFVHEALQYVEFNDNLDIVILLMEVLIE